ncbi:helix-turn-helix domain-containing protein [Streptomyces sp. NPDC054784]
MHNTPTTFQVNGSAIRERRKQLGLETRELAERAGISRRYLSHLENGYRDRMRPGRYVALRAALDVDSGDPQLLAPPPHEDTRQENPDGRDAHQVREVPPPAQAG